MLPSLEPFTSTFSTSFIPPANHLRKPRSQRREDTNLQISAPCLPEAGCAQVRPARMNQKGNIPSISVNLRPAERCQGGQAETRGGCFFPGGSALGRSAVQWWRGVGEHPGAALPACLWGSIPGSPRPTAGGGPRGGWAHCQPLHAAHPFVTPSPSARQNGRLTFSLRCFEK